MSELSGADFGRVIRDCESNLLVEKKRPRHVGGAGLSTLVCGARAERMRSGVWSIPRSLQSRNDCGVLTVQTLANRQNLSSGAVVALDQIGHFLAAVHDRGVISSAEGLADRGQRRL